MTDAFPTGYRNADICVISDRIYGCIATKTDTSEIWFAQTTDGGQTWSTPVLAVTLDSGNKALLRFAGKFKLLITNTLRPVAQSVNLGRTWEAL